MNWQQLIEAGKIWQVYPDNEKDNILFEGTKTQCQNFIQLNCPYYYKKGLVRLAKLIYETKKP